MVKDSESPRFSTPGLLSENLMTSEHPLYDKDLEGFRNGVGPVAVAMVSGPNPSVTLESADYLSGEIIYVGGLEHSFLSSMSLVTIVREDGPRRIAQVADVQPLGGGQFRARAYMPFGKEPVSQVDPLSLV